MNLKIGELFMLGFRGREIPPWLMNFAEKYGLGGVILFDYDCTDKKYERNVVSPEQVKSLCQQIHALPSSPRVYVDQEGGKVRRLKDRYGFKPLPSAKEYARMPKAERVAVLKTSYLELKAVGVDVNLAPVIDLDFNPLSPDLGKVERCYSADARVVEDCVREVVEIARTVGLELCLKHFPGCGGAKVNSHNELMNISESLDEGQLELFKKSMAQIPMVLFSHGIVDPWEKGVPVCMSKVAIGKARAWFPETRILTDDLQMEGMQRVMSTNEACVRAIRAGADMMCIGNNLRDEQAACDGFAQSLLEACAREAEVRSNAETSIQRMRKLKNR